MYCKAGQARLVHLTGTNLSPYVVDDGTNLNLNAIPAEVPPRITPDISPWYTCSPLYWIAQAGLNRNLCSYFIPPQY